MKVLNLICPECQLEQLIQQSRPDCHHFFISSIGNYHDFNDVLFTEEIKEFIRDNGIDRIAIYNSTSCRFISDVASQQGGHPTLAHARINDIYFDQLEELIFADEVERKERLSLLTSQQLEEDIQQAPFLSQLFDEGSLSLDSFVVNRERQEITQVIPAQIQ